LQHNAIFEAGRLLSKLESFQMPIRLIETTKSSLLGLSAAGLGTATLGACAITGTPTALHAPTPNPPRAWPGPYQVGEVILGESGGTIAMPNPYTLNQLPVRDLGAADRIGL
jgi:hypothetical protein